MNPKVLMTLSAVALALTGLVLIFLPDELAAYLTLAPATFSTLILQLLGTLYLAFAALNWTAKANLIGGIYSRPVALANFTHFTVGGLTLLKAAFAAQHTPFIWVSAGLYALFAGSFALVLYRHPLKK